MSAPRSIGPDYSGKHRRDSAGLRPAASPAYRAGPAGRSGLRPHGASGARPGPDAAEPGS